MIEEGLGYLERSAGGDTVSSYHLEAEIASYHAIAPTWSATDWPRILHCYSELEALNPSPVVTLNRVVARWQVEGPDAALADLELLMASGRLDKYHPAHATRGELLARVGDYEAATEAFRRALGLSRTGPLQRHLERRLASVVALI